MELQVSNTEIYEKIRHLPGIAVSAQIYCARMLLIRSHYSDRVFFFPQLTVVLLR